MAPHPDFPDDDEDEDTGITPASVELSQRLDDALGSHDVSSDDKERIQAAYVAAGWMAATWEDLPEDIRELVEDIEQLPRTGWDDPLDAPDED